MLVKSLLSAIVALSLAVPASAVLTFDTDVTPNAIFGSGNANGGWSVSTNHGVELGLRAKLRYDANDQPQNVFNFSGTVPVGIDMVPYGHYQFPTGSRAGDANRPIWNFEFSINTDVDGTTGKSLNDLTYVLVFQTVSGGSTFIPFGDVINVAFADHSIGNNSTGNGMGVEATNATEYAALIDSNNVAQQSWNIDFFTPSFDPSVVSETRIILSAFDFSPGGLGFIGQSAIVVSAVPEPTAALFGTLMASGLGMTIARRRRDAEEIA